MGGSCCAILRTNFSAKIDLHLCVHDCAMERDTGLLGGAMAMKETAVDGFGITCCATCK